MSLIVTGSIGVDTITTPYGCNHDCIGGSAIYFSLAASYFAQVNFMGVAGEDCPFDLAEFFAGRKVNLDGLEIREGSKTFRWTGSYQGSMNEAHTDAVELNVLAEDPPHVPDSYRNSEYVFLANTSPALQMKLLDEMGRTSFVAADTMNLWITTAKDDLKKLMERIDMLILNDGEARLLTGQPNLMNAAKAILDMGPQYVIIKKGEHGSMLYDYAGQMFLLPAYPTALVIDPTGAGDSFAGGMMGYLAQAGTVDYMTMRKAMVYGTVVSSFTIGDFSVHGIQTATMEKIDERFELLRKVTQF